MNEKQLEFFKDNKDSAASETRPRTVIKIPLDTVILFSIIDLFIIFIAFALGVKKGAGSHELATVSPEVATTKVQDSVEITPAEEQKNEVATEDKQTSQEKAEKENYLIQLASYKNKKIAKQQKDFLLKKGFSPLLTKKGEYLILCASGFNDMASARAAKKKLQRRYKDCFIRRQD
jgi:cell division protein FtsN